MYIGDIYLPILSSIDKKSVSKITKEIAGINAKTSFWTPARIGAGIGVVLLVVLLAYAAITRGESLRLARVLYRAQRRQALTAIIGGLLVMILVIAAAM